MESAPKSEKTDEKTVPPTVAAVTMVDLLSGDNHVERS